MRKITVAGENGYEILLGRGLLNKAGSLIREVTSASRVLIISDTNVFSIYGEQVKVSLEANGFEAFSYVFKAGEERKTLDTVSEMVKALCENGLSRKDIVVALGGGVTGDMAGFASAIYLRGIDFVQIPTSLLSQVDSSVGGKTGCDLSFGKNLVGAFHNPRLVIIDPNTIKTLPERYVNDGIGEIIKCGCIKSEALIRTLEQCETFDEVLEDAVYECVDIKRAVVENDFTEQGERMLLNFGHTLAHAIEKYSDFTGIAHGEAVGVGMLNITRASEKLGETETGSADRIKALLEKFNLPTSFKAETKELVDIMLYDKKRRANMMNLIFIKKVGDAFIRPMAIEELCGFFSEGNV